MTTEPTQADATARLRAINDVLTQVEADNARLNELLELLPAAAERSATLGTYYQQQWGQDRDTHLENCGDDQSLHWVCSEDAIWNAFVDSDNAWLRLMREAANHVAQTHITEGGCGCDDAGCDA